MDRLSDEFRSELSRFGPQAGLAELIDRWPGVVGAAIARNAWPARLGRDGTLHVATADAIWAFELAHRGEEIAGRLAVSRVRFAAGPLPVETAPAAAPEVQHPGDEERRLAAEIVSGLGDERLRESVQKAVSLGLARAAANRRF